MKKRPSFRQDQWIKSTVSSDTGCVEVAYSDGWVGVRDTKLSSSPILTFTEHEWRCFLTGAAAGEFTVDALSRH